MKDVFVSSSGLEDFFLPIVGTAATMRKRDAMRTQYDQTRRRHSFVITDHDIYT